MHIIVTAKSIFITLNMLKFLNMLQTFRVYVKGTSGPVLLLLHGGGHSALSWAVFAVSAAMGNESLISDIIMV